VEPLPGESRQPKHIPVEKAPVAQISTELPTSRDITPEPDFGPTNDFPFPAEDPQSENSEQPFPNKLAVPESPELQPAEEVLTSPTPEENLSITVEEQPSNVPEPEQIARQEKIGAITLDEDSTYLITIILKNRGDTMRDKLRLRQIYGTLISYPGKDRFAFQISENDQSHLLEFPNASTKISKNLINQLRDMLGRENVQVEKYLF